MKFSIFIALFSLFLNTFTQAQTSKVTMVDIDSVYEKVGFSKENELFMTDLSLKLTEKDSFMVIKFQKHAEDVLADNAAYEDFAFVNRRYDSLEKEQQRIILFEKKMANVITKLEAKLKNWGEDYIRKEVRFFGYQRGLTNILSKKAIRYAAEMPQDLTEEICLFIKNNNVWRNALLYQREVIKSKILFDFGLD